MTPESSKKSNFSLPKSISHEFAGHSGEVTPVYDGAGTFQGAIIDGTWWWPEDLRLLRPELDASHHERRTNR